MRWGAVKTAAVNLAGDVALAVLVVVIPAMSGSDTDWSLVWGSALKTAGATLAVGLRNWLAGRRAAGTSEG